MTILLSFFFISLISFSIMFERRLALLKSQDMYEIEKKHSTLEVPYMLEIKDITIKGVKKVGYVSIVTTIRLYFRSINFLKYRYEKLKAITKNVNREAKNGTEKEVSKFLKVVSDYKYKIRKIKHQIKEEEKMK